MTEKVGIEQLAEKLRLLTLKDVRQVVALAGPPGAGKSYIADRLFEGLELEVPGKAQILPMDGFHYDDMVLLARGDLLRKGAPHTFDTGGMLSALKRIKADDNNSVAVPVFDRSIEIARAGARVIGPEARLIIAEGNYLLLDHDDWRPLATLFDMTVFIDVPEGVLEKRLNERWSHFSHEERTQKLDGNDLPNMRLVVSNSVAADVLINNA